MLGTIDNPFDPRIFLSQNLYTNMDFLLSRTHSGGIMEEETRVFLWLIWYIWKVRNEKLFNGRDFSPMDTTDLALTGMQRLVHCQPRRWSKGIHLRNFTRKPHRDPYFHFPCGWLMETWWHHKWSGLDSTPTRWINWSTWLTRLLQENFATSLTWALKCLSRHRRYCNHFVTDSQELVKMIETPKDWPAFAHELSELKSLWETWYTRSDPVTLKQISF